MEAPIIADEEEGVGGGAKKTTARKHGPVFFTFS